MKRENLLGEIREYSKKKQKYSRMMPSARHNLLKEKDKKIREGLKRENIIGW